MKYGVVIPILIKDVVAQQGCFQPVRYFLDRGVPVALVLNGGTDEEAVACQRFFEFYPDHFILSYGGAAGNPYPSRNVGLSVMFASQEVDAVALIDSDTEVAVDYHDWAMKLFSADKLIAGRINTKVPHGVSTHLNWLNEINFECFDGYAPPDSTIGANMIIGKKVFDTVGHMKDDVMSGGDADYSTRAKTLGISVSHHKELLVSKVIGKYSYRVIIEKQIRRALCLNPALAAPQKDTIHALRAALRKHLHALEGADSLDDLKPRYGELIDSLFALMWFEGMLANHIDRRK